MAVAPRVFPDHVAPDPSQAGCATVGPGAPGQPLQAAVDQRLRDQGGGAGRFQVKSMVSFSLHAKKRVMPPG
jgi:hypothetical protein